MGKVRIISVLSLVVILLGLGFTQISKPEEPKPEDDFKCQHLDHSTSPTPETIRLSIRSNFAETVLEFPREYIQTQAPWDCQKIKSRVEKSKNPDLLKWLEGHNRYVNIEARLPDLVPEKYAKRELDPIHGKNSFTPIHSSYDKTLIVLEQSSGFVTEILEARYKSKRYFFTNEEGNSDQEVYGLFDMGFEMYKDSISGEWLQSISESRYYWPVEEPENFGFFMYCVEIPDYPATKCSASRDVTPNLRIRYAFHSGYLADWKDIDNKVLDLISSWMVNQEDKDMLEKSRFKDD